MMKIKIKTGFDAASHCYDSVAHIQKNSAQVLTAFLYKSAPKFRPKTIMDLGTGTGYVPETLLLSFPDALYTLNDIAPNMIKVTQDKFNKYKNFNFLVGDMEQVIFGNHDLIISNLALQWADNLEKTILKFSRKSKIFAFSFLLNGSFKEWSSIFASYNLPSPIKKYPNARDIINFVSSFEGCKYHYSAKVFHLKFKNARSFMKYLQSLGALTSTATIPLPGIKNLLKNHNQEFTITYKIFFGIIQRL